MRSVPALPAAAGMPWVADLHIHSKYSRACSRDLELENLAWWAQRKGIALLGTGDFTHPGWFDHLRALLRPAEPGLHRLVNEAQERVNRRLPAGLTEPVRFLLSTEISTIYKRGERTRKVHHLVYLPDLEAVARLNARLGHGEGGLGLNLGSDGRPILGLDSRDLLEIVLESDDQAMLVPAHIWTPWFSALGSRSGFDAIEDCYADLAGHIHAVETGLSSDPAMNWRVSSLDRYRLVSNSDAHSPQALAREATLLTTELDYGAVKAALETGTGLAGTLEFFPEEGKYHADGHRACDVVWDPARTRSAGGLCPKCDKPLTVGVLHRVEELADRPTGYAPASPPAVTHLIQLNQVLGEVHGTGAKSKGVQQRLDRLVAALGSELDILRHTPIPDLVRVGGERLGEALRRLRAGEVRRSPGYDGEYGTVRLFDAGEVTGPERSLFDLPAQAHPRERGRPKAAPAGTPAAPRQRTRAAAPRRGAARAEAVRPLAPDPSPHRPWEPMLDGLEAVGTGLLDRLDSMQRVAASAGEGALLVVAGPGTGKTRTLTHRIAYLCADLGAAPEECLAITFTRRAAEEMRERLDVLLGEAAPWVSVFTFHALGLALLRENAAAAGLPADFGVADEAQVAAARAAAPRSGATAEAGEAAYREALRRQGLVDFDELTTLPVRLLTEDPQLVRRYRLRWRWVFVDEYQDVDATQYQLLRLLVPESGNICAIGDPDQAIYSFRGADVGYFLRFAQDFTDARVVRLARNYRSAAPIIAAASQVIAPTSLVRGRRLEPARVDPDACLVGLHAAPNTGAEAQWVAATIDELVGGVSHRSFDSRVDSRGAGGLAFADIAVLYRTDAQAAPVLEALTRAGIPVQKRSHDRLADRRAVAAIARELRFAGGVGGDLVERVREAGRRLATGAPRLFDGDLDVAAPVELGEAEVYSAVELLTPLARRHGGDLAEFLLALATGAESDAMDPRAQAVSLLTLHAAKGLEWPAVFLVGCEDGLLPLRLPGRALSEEEKAEERRLFYVGLTRAGGRLFLSHVARRHRHGAEQAAARTPFLDAVDPGLLERLGAVDGQPARPAHRQLRLL